MDTETAKRGETKVNYLEAKTYLINLGISEGGAISWANYLTRDGRKTSIREIEDLVSKKLPATRAALQKQRENLPAILTTPETEVEWR
jgi:hypothetical protein